MKTLINSSALDVGQVRAKMDHKIPNTARLAFEDGVVVKMHLNMVGFSPTAIST